MWRPFINAGIGVYNVDPGDNTRAAANAGAGVLYELTPSFGIEGVYNFHFIRAETLSFSTVQVGVRFAF